MENKITSRRITLGYLLIFLMLNLLALDRMLIPWIDEVMNAEPGWRLFSTGRLFSMTFPFPGAEEKFLAYLPATPLLHYLGFTLLPKTVFWTRFPVFLLFAASTFLMFKLLRRDFILKGGGFLVVFILFLHDESLLRALRGTRVEVLEVFLLLLTIFLGRHATWRTFAAIPIGLMLVTHPKLWVLAGVSFYFFCFRGSSFKQGLVNVLIVILPALGYLAFADFDFLAIKNQLFVHGEEHVAQGNLFYNHFVARFLPNYFAQPWWFILHPLALALGIRRVWKSALAPESVYAWMLLTTTLFWLVVLGPFVRYMPVLIILSLFALLQELKLNRTQLSRYLNSNLAKISLATLLLVAIAPFYYRFYQAVDQWEERDSQIALEWLDTELPSQGKTLLIDGAVGFYYDLNHANTDFTLRYTLPKYNFNEYDAVYLLTVREEYKAMLSEPYSTFAQFTKASAKAKKGSFIGYELFKINSEKEYLDLIPRD